jgi:hypothetical protein
MTRLKAEEDPEGKRSLDNDDCPESGHLSDDGVVPEDDCKKEEASLFVPPDTFMAISHEIDAGTAPGSATKVSDLIASPLTLH